MVALCSGVASCAAHTTPGIGAALHQRRQRSVPRPTRPPCSSSRASPARVVCSAHSTCRASLARHCSPQRPPRQCPTRAPSLLSQPCPQRPQRPQRSLHVLPQAAPRRTTTFSQDESDGDAVLALEDALRLLPSPAQWPQLVLLEMAGLQSLRMPWRLGPLRSISSSPATPGAVAGRGRARAATAGLAHLRCTSEVCQSLQHAAACQCIVKEQILSTRLSIEHWTSTCDLLTWLLSSSPGFTLLTVVEHNNGSDGLDYASRVTITYASERWDILLFSSIQLQFFQDRRFINS